MRCEGGTKQLTLLTGCRPLRTVAIRDDEAIDDIDTVRWSRRRGEERFESKFAESNARPRASFLLVPPSCGPIAVSSFFPSFLFFLFLFFSFLFLPLLSSSCDTYRARSTIRVPASSSSSSQLETLCLMKHDVIIAWLKHLAEV